MNNAVGTGCDRVDDEHHSAYFDAQTSTSNVELWRRAGDVDVKGARVLDLGCGHGALSLDLFRRGAAYVVGTDLDGDRIRFANDNLAKLAPEAAGRVSFHCAEVATLSDRFDWIVSKDTFEHIDDLENTMMQLLGVLKPGGRLLSGFGPLYYSPFGDHGRFRGRGRGMPWLPALLPEPILFKLASRWRGRTIKSSSELGLNKLTPRQFREIVRRQGWTIETLKYNAGTKQGMPLMRTIRKLPFLEKYFTVNMYVVLRRPV